MTQTTHTPEAQETNRQATVARLLGATSFSTIRWQQLMQDGALVQLHIGRCRFSTRLLLEDMGIQIEDGAIRDKLSRWMTLGEKRLLPEAYMKSLSRIESRARAALKEHAFRTELGNFVPVTAYEMWRTKNEALQTEYLALRDEIIANHRDLERQVVTEYEAIATDTYQRLRATHPTLVQEGQQAFVTTYCNRIAGQIPSVERIRESFSFRFFRVEGAHQLGAVPEASAPPAPEDTLVQQRLQADQVARSRALLDQDVRHDAQARVTVLLDDFLTSIVAQLRGLTYDAVTDVLTTMQRRGGESFSPRSTMQLSNLLTQIRQLNFFGDTEIDQMMQRIQEIVELSPAVRKRSIGEIERTLRAVATTTRATLLDLDEETRTPRSELGIAAVPTYQLVHAARAELRLPAIDFANVASQPAAVRTARAELAPEDTSSIWHFAEGGGQRLATRTSRTL